MQKKDKIIIISAFSVLALLLLTAIIMLLIQHREIKSQNAEIEEMTAVMEFEKQQSIDEFEQMQKQYEDYYINTNNDSLLKLIDDEKQKVQQLLQELRTVKATNTRRIAELKKELSTVRGVLKTYVERVDSLNTVNSNLRTENQRVKRQYEERSRELEEQIAQKEELDKKYMIDLLSDGSEELKGMLKALWVTLQAVLTVPIRRKEYNYTF